MTTYGVTATGFVLKPLDVIKTEIAADVHSLIGPTVDTEADSFIGNLIGIFGAKIAEVWEVMQGTYASQYPDFATGASLDEAAAITGAARLPATKSVVNVVCTGTPGTALASGRKLSVPASGAQFASVGAFVIGGGGTVTVPFQAVTTGPTIANAGTLTHIDTPVAGWASATNPADAIVGANIETDEAFRQRRLLLLDAGGNGDEEAIRSALIGVSGVTEAIVLNNDLDITVDTIPPHAIECLVVGGVDADIRAAIFASKADGIQAFGSTHGTVVDVNADVHEIDFTRPVDEVLHIEVTVLIDPATFPATGDAMIKASLAAFGLSVFKIGQDVVRNKLFEPVFRDYTQGFKLPPEIPGIEDVTDLQIKFGGAFGTANLAVTQRQIATLDTANITVSHA